MTDIEQRIAKLRELDKARTQGEWKITIDSCATCEKNGTAEYCIYDIPSGNHGDYARKEDAQFIAAAPEMVQVIEELLAENKTLQCQLHAALAVPEAQTQVDVWNRATERLKEINKQALAEIEGD